MPSPESSSPQLPDQPQTISRRELLIKAAGGIVAFGAGSVLAIDGYQRASDATQITRTIPYTSTDPQDIENRRAATDQGLIGVGEEIVGGGTAIAVVVFGIKSLSRALPKLVERVPWEKIIPDAK